MISNEEILLEQEILSGIIQENNLIAKCREIIKSEMFQIQAHKEIYATINKMLIEGIGVELIVLLNYIGKDSARLGGVTYITEVSMCSTSNRNFDSKLNFLVENFNKRQIQKLAYDLQKEDSIKSMIELIDETRESIYKTDIQKDIDITEQYEGYLGQINSGKKEKGFLTRLIFLDDYIGGLRRGRLITVFARSGIGKSTFAIQIAMNLVLQGYKVFYGSGEMSNIEVYNKMVASKLDIQYSRLDKLELEEKEKNEINKFMVRLLNNGFYVSNETNMEKFINEIMLYKMKFGVDIVFVDYVNKYIGGANGNNLSERIGYITACLKEIALKENICIVLLAQGNRRADNSNNTDVATKLNVADIQDSARIEQDSDQIIALYRNLQFDNRALRDKLFKDGLIDYNTRNAEKNPEIINATILKNRHGKKGTIALKWEGEYSRIKNFNK